MQNGSSLGIRLDSHQVTPQRGRKVWNLLADKKTSRSVVISSYLRKTGMNILALPLGTAQIENLPALLMERNRLGTVGVVSGSGFIRYRARYDDGASVDGPPNADDLKVPEKEDPALSKIASELGLASRPPPQTLETIASFFKNNFSYSTHLKRGRSVAPWRRNTPLTDFLLDHRSGHCEYFATATVLLLRKAGIPARYSTGYSVQEYDRLRKMYVIRNRGMPGTGLAGRRLAKLRHHTRLVGSLSKKNASAFGFTTGGHGLSSDSNGSG